MVESKNNIKISIGSNKSFGVVFAFLFLLLAFYPLMVDGESISYGWLIAAVLFASFSYLYPQVFNMPNKLWFKLGIIIGAIVSPVVMAIVYFIAVVPIGLLMKGLGKDLLNIQLDKDCHSYWIERNDPLRSMKDQF